VDRAAIKSARIQFERAAQNIDELATEKNLAEIERHWAAFLVNAGRVFTKLEQASKASPKGKTWWSGKIRERRSDELLLYIWHARNADEHGIRRVTEQYISEVKAASPIPEEFEAANREAAKRGLPYAVLGAFDITMRVKLVDVIDRGVRYAVPATFRGNPISNPHPNNVGLLALSYLDGLIREADNFPES
jgi:hypothetical protein